MRGFTEEIIAELKAPDDDCCKLAFLSGAIHAAGTIERTGGESRIVVNRMAAPLLDGALYDMFGVHAVPNEKTVHIGGDVMRILFELGILGVSDEGLTVVNEGIEPHLVVDACCKAAYLRGVFAGAGSMTAGKSGNRLQFAVTYPQFAEDLSTLLSALGVPSFVTGHKEKSITYVKRAQGISDCLVLLGATKTMLAFEAHLAASEQRRELNRVNNVEVANIERAAVAGADQCAAIRYIERTVGLQALDKKLRDVAELRLTESAMAYGEMGEALGISKSTVKYRLEKLTAFSRKLQEQEET